MIGLSLVIKIQAVNDNTWEENIPLVKNKEERKRSKLKSTRVLQDIPVQLQISYLHSPDNEPHVVQQSVPPQRASKNCWIKSGM